MKKILVFALAMVMALSLVACGGAQQAAVDKDMAGSVAMVLSGLITDQAFNQYTYQGMMRAADELGIKTAYKESVTQDEQVEVIRQFAQAGYSIVIGQGGQFGEALAIVAKEFPDTQFIFSVGTETNDIPNLSAATVSYSHAGFIGGILAGLTTKTNKVAMVTGEFYDNHRMMEAGFYAGVAYVNSAIETTAITTGDWSDPVKARESCMALIAQGYDVLFPCLDAAGAGVAAAAQDSKDVWVVGSVADYAADYGAQNVTVGSVVFAWEALGYLEATGGLCDGQSHIIGMADNGIDPVINATLTAEQQAIYDAAVADLIAGKIDIVD
ncbi:MAG TPA: BMP family protein [Clostridia bacterium]|nr:BMP family protein [Clostridia bacterium]